MVPSIRYSGYLISLVTASVALAEPPAPRICPTNQVIVLHSPCRLEDRSPPGRNRLLGFEALP